jgi:hypothetical protein
VGLLNSVNRTTTTGINSAIVLAGGTLNTCNVDRASILGSGISATSKNLTGSTFVGAIPSAIINDARSALCIASQTTTPAAITFAGVNSGYIGNQVAAETLAAQDIMISRYARFFLKTLRLATGANVAYYDPITGEMTYGASPVAQKQPATLGTSFGMTSSTVEICGQGNFLNYPTGSPLLSQVAAIGNNIFPTNTTTTFQRVNILGNSVSAPNLTNLSDVILGGPLGFSTNVTNLSNSVILTSRQGSFQASLTPASISNIIAIHTGTVADTTVFDGSISLGTNTTVQPGRSSIILTTNPGSINANTENVVLYSSSTTAAPVITFIRTCVIASGPNPPVPQNSEEMVISYQRFRAPNLVDTTSPLVGSQTVVYSDGYFVRTSSNNFSRVLRRQAVTNASGVAALTIGNGIITSLTDASAQATVVSTSTTVAHTAHILDFQLTSISFQVMVSTNGVVGSPTMVPAGPGITVHVSISY